MQFFVRTSPPNTCTRFPYSVENSLNCLNWKVLGTTRETRQLSCWHESCSTDAHSFLDSSCITQSVGALNQQDQLERLHSCPDVMSLAVLMPILCWMVLMASPNLLVSLNHQDHLERPESCPTVS